MAGTYVGIVVYLFTQDIVRVTFTPDFKDQITKKLRLKELDKSIKMKNMNIAKKS
jgi:hypothetical protein